MRAASVGMDGVLRDSDGIPIGQRRAVVRRAVPPAVVLRPAHPAHSARPARPPGVARGHYKNQAVPAILRSPYLVRMGQAPETPATVGVGPARSLANQKGFPTSGLAYSKQISDPATTVYPSRIVYQTTDDPTSLYVVSRRMPSKPDHVKLLKIEGVGKGRWFEIPLARTTDEKGKVVPGLMTDFMVVPQQSTSLVWWYVHGLQPIFEGSSEADLMRVSPGYIKSALLVAQIGFEEFPESDAEIKSGIASVITNTTTIILTAMHGIDCVDAAYDVSAIGNKVYSNYMKVGKDLLDSSKAILDAAYQAQTDPSSIDASIRVIAAHRNEILRRKRLHDAYINRAELFNAGSFCSSITTDQDVWATMRQLMGELVEYIGSKKSELLRQGYAEADLVSMQSLASAYVVRYDNADEKFKTALGEFLEKNNTDIGAAYQMELMIPKLLYENTREIEEELNIIKAGPPLPVASTSFVSLSGLGAIPGENLKRSFREVHEVGKKLPNIRNRTGIISGLERALPYLKDTVEKLTEKIEAVRGYLAREGFQTQQALALRDDQLKADLKVAEKKHSVAEKERDRLAADTNSSAAERDNAARVVNLAKSQIDRIKTEREQIKIALNAHGIVSVEMYQYALDVMKPVNELRPEQRGTVDEVIAYIKVLTDLKRNEYAGFLTHFKIEAIDSLAKFVYSFRLEKMQAKAWYEIISTAGQKIGMIDNQPWTDYEFIKVIDRKVESIAKDLKVDVFILRNIAKDIKRDPAGVKSISDGALEGSFKKVMKEGPDADRLTAEKVKTQLTKAAIWQNLVDQYVIGQTAPSWNRIEPSRTLAEMVSARYAGTTRILTRPEYTEIIKRLGDMNVFLERTGANKETPSAEREFLESLIRVDESKRDTFANRLAATEEGRRIQAEIKELIGLVEAGFEPVKGSYGKTYEEFLSNVKALEEEAGEVKADDVRREQQERYEAYLKLSDQFEKLRNLRLKAETMAREWNLAKKAFWYMWDVSLNWFNLINGPGVKMMSEVKVGGPVAQALYSILGFLTLSAQLGSVLGIASVFNVPGTTVVKDLLNGMLARASGLFNGGNATQSNNPPAAGTPPGSFFPLLVFGAAIAMITSGKAVFEAISKTAGGFFNFAAALMPGSKKKGAKGFGPGGGGGGGRRGPKVDVDKWIEELEAAKQRLSEAETDKEKRNAQNMINLAKKKLKKAKEEGEDVPDELLLDGFWGFNWLG